MAKSKVKRSKQIKRLKARQEHFDLVLSKSPTRAFKRPGSIRK